MRYLVATVLQTEDEMTDDVDRAQIEIAVQLENARRAIQAAPRVIGTGHCHNCEEALRNLEQLFRDQECAKDFERRKLGRSFTKLPTNQRDELFRPA
jgi:hypothetical protein